MENELLVELKRVQKICAKRDRALRERLEGLTDVSEINTVKSEIRKNRATYDAAVEDQKAFVESNEELERLQNKGDQKAYLAACISNIELEEALCKKYNVVKEERVAEPEEEKDEEVQRVVAVTTPETEKKHSHAGLVAWTLVGGLAAGAVAGYLAGNIPSKSKKAEPGTVTPSESENATIVPEEKPFEVFGEFTDVNNEKQLRARAEWFYKTYIAESTKAKAGGKLYTVEDIMNIMRMINGEFMRDANGHTTYNETDMIAVANDLHTIANYDSFVQYGNQIYFTPLAPLFEDGSLAQQGAIDLDNAMAKVVTTIRNCDDEAFLQAAKEWGAVVLNMFNYVDYTGEYVNIYQVDAPTSFALYHAMNAKYASTILEYSQAHHLNVCVPYCVDYNTGLTVEEPLSQIMYNLNERALDAVAVRSGNLEEYEANNLSLPEDLYLLAKNYYNSKYQLENGNSRSLK